MARPTWRGAVSFGMVSVPVQLFTAVRSTSVRFRQLNRSTHEPVRQKRVDASSGEEVAYDDIVKGYEVRPGHYVVVDRSELDALDPGASRTIEIHDFVEQPQIDPVYYDRAYYLAPDGESSVKPYRLLTSAMQRTNRVAVARFVMRGKEYLAAIRAHDGVLVLSTMHFSDEVATPAELDAEAFEPDKVELRDRELAMAEQLIEAMTTTFDPDAYKDEHTGRVLEYLEAKAADETVSPTTESERRGGEVIDLMAALESSLQRSQAGGGTRSGGDTGAGDGSRVGRRARSESEGSQGQAPDYGGMTRNALYALAQERELPGRSSMSKQQLVEALRASDASAGAA